MNPIFSIIIPVYNLEVYLPICLDSIVNQSFQNFEIILVNDGSLDNSLKICYSYAKLDKKISVVDIPNSGVSNARNIGIQRAKGEYIWFIDGDDWIGTDSLKILFEIMNKDSLEILSFHYSVFDENQKKFVAPFKIAKDINITTGFDFIENEVKPNTWSYLFERNFLINNSLRFTNICIGEDEMFVWKSMLLANKVKQITNQFYNYRIRDNSTISGIVTMKKLLSRVKMISFFKSLQKENNINFENNIEKYIYNIFYELIKCKMSYKKKSILLKIVKNNSQNLIIKNSDFINVKLFKFFFNTNIYSAYCFLKIKTVIIDIKNLI